MSFVQRPRTSHAARAAIAAAGRPEVPLVAKIERPEALERLDEILAAADGVMVARGDLGLEIPLQRVPRVQREILRRARALRRSCDPGDAGAGVDAHESRPTRAEVSDAATAVMQGADAIMLSGETAAGALSRPRRADARRDHPGSRDRPSVPQPRRSAPADHVAALCDAAVTLAGRSPARRPSSPITREGRTARLLSMRRPAAPIYAATDREEVARGLAQWWGVNALVTETEGDVDAVAAGVLDHLVHDGQIAAGSTVVVVNTSPDLDRGAANFLRVRRT